MCRVLQRLKRRNLRRETITVEVVFARSSLGSSDPIVAVLSSEEEVLKLRLELLNRWPELDVTWSSHVVRGAPLHFDGVVHFVTQCGLLSPVVVDAFAWAPDAVRLAFKEERNLHLRTRAYVSTPDAVRRVFKRRVREPFLNNDINIRSLPIGWRAPGEPWLEVEDE